MSLHPSPVASKKWRVVLRDGTTVDFGAASYEDYTTHRDPYRMARYLRRHGGVGVPADAASMPPAKLHAAMLRVTRSTKENWADPRTPGYWSRWLLWSHPSIETAWRRLFRATSSKR